MVANVNARKWLRTFLGPMLCTGGLIVEAADNSALQAAGIRRLEGKHITLFTDLPSSPAVDELPRAFDLAIPNWTRFFGVHQSVFSTWHVDACVMRDKERFRQSGLLPPNLPPFLNGLQMIDQIWINEQPSDYYRRHLLLHEGTHAAVNRIYGHVGPAWYREGIAELLGTHQFDKDVLHLSQFPADKRLVEHWGRIKIVKDEINKGNSKSIRDIVTLQARDYLSVDAYAWSWALLAFGYKHPHFATTFRQAHEDMKVSSQYVTSNFLARYEQRRPEIDVAWELFKSHLDYGYDSSQELVTKSSLTIELDGTANAVVDVTKGWQSSGIRVKGKSTIEFAAQGRFQITRAPEVWLCEPQGVTIKYYQGQPLGKLMVAVMDDQDEVSDQSLVNPTYIGRRGRLTVGDSGGVLYFRINERADHLRDNSGKIAVKLRYQS